MGTAIELLKGNDAVVKGAILAGATHYFGYPITPASEIAHDAAKYFPKLDRVFLQAESEIAAINMVYGAASAGARVMTASSGPGISLKVEGISYLAGAELPCVIVDVMRAGPGLGNIFPEQSDYNQVVKGGGHGNYKVIVLAPNSAQEMADMAYKAFDLAEKYRTPVFILTDAYVGQMMEPVTFHQKAKTVDRKDWSVYGDKTSRKNLISSIYMSQEDLESFNQKLALKYVEIAKNETEYEEYQTDNADTVIVAYGAPSRVSMTVIDELRLKGVKVGLFRPKTLMPFPYDALKNATKNASRIIAVELSTGQMIDDVKLATNRDDIELYNRMGGFLPSVEDLKSYILSSEKRVYKDYTKYESRTNV